MMRVVLPYHLRTLAHTGREVQLQVGEPVTQRAVLDALEAQYPTRQMRKIDVGALENARDQR